MNINQPSAVSSAAEKSIKAADLESENGFVAEIQRMAQEALGLFGKWHIPATSVFGEWQGHMIRVTIFAPDPANLPGPHAGAEGE